MFARVNVGSPPSVSCHEMSCMSMSPRSGCLKPVALAPPPPPVVPPEPAAPPGAGTAPLDEHAVMHAAKKRATSHNGNARRSMFTFLRDKDVEGIGQPAIEKIGVRNEPVPVDPEACTPRITEDEARLNVIVAGEVDEIGLPYGIGAVDVVESVVDFGSPEHRVSRRQIGLDQRKVGELD